MFFNFLVKSINGPLKFDKLKVDYEKSENPVGVSQMSWSFDSNFIATKNGKDKILLFLIIIIHN